MGSFGAALEEARKSMGWDRRSLGTALRMSDKTIGHLESEGEPDLPAARAVVNLMREYGIEFTDDFKSVQKRPDLRDRYFLTMDFRFDPDQDERVRDITRRMQVVGMSVVRRFNKARNTSSSFDGVELHVPPVNRRSFEAVLEKFLETHGPSNCLVRNEKGMRLTREEIPDLWDYVI